MPVSAKPNWHRSKRSVQDPGNRQRADDGNNAANAGMGYYRFMSFLLCVKKRIAENIIRQTS
jgi:hypothetical protein